MAHSGLPSALRSLVLNHLRIYSSSSLATASTFSASSQVPPLSVPFLRLFGDAASGTYLDKQEVTDRVINVVKSFPKVDSSKVSPSSHFNNDLGLDSLDSVELVMAFEEEFALEIPDAEADKILTCADAINFLASHPQAK